MRCQVPDRQRTTAHHMAPSTWHVLRGYAGVPGWVTGWNDDRRSRPLQAPSVSSRGHRPRRVAVFPFSARAADGGGAAGRARHHRQPRTVRQWASKFGQRFANQIRRRLPRVGDKWHLDEVVLKIASVKHWLWRAVDQTGVVLDVLVQRRATSRLPSGYCASS